MKRQYLRTLVIWTFVLCLSVSAAALDPNRRISQYAHTAWRIQDGYFNGTPQAIAQTTDGYLWIGTENGLVRFDGVRFVSWIAPNGKQLPTSRIHSLLAAKDGSLWIGTARGLAHWDSNGLANLSLSPSFVEAIVQDSAGTVWISRSQIHDPDGPLCRVNGNGLHCYGPSDGISFPYAQPLSSDASGNLWIGSSTGLSRWKPGDSKTFTTSALPAFKGLTGVAAIATKPDGSVFVGIKRSDKGLGLLQVVQDRLQDYAVPGMDASVADIRALLIDRDNDLWVGTSNHGVYRIHGGHADNFRSSDGLSSDAVQGFYEDHEGDLWVATSRGIDRFHDTPVVSYSIREGLTSEDVDSVLASRDGSLWIGNTVALDVLRQGEPSAIGPRNGFPGRLTTSLFEDHAGRLWVGVDGGLTVYENGHFHTIHAPDGKPLGVVVAITEDVDHNIWANVTAPALVRIQDLSVREEFSPPQIPRVVSLAPDPKGGVFLGLTNGNLARLRRGKLETLSTDTRATHSIRNLLVDSDGSVWGATQEGAFRWSDGKEENLNSHNGLPCDDVYTILKDNRGSLWLDALCGFVVIDATELEKWKKQPDIQVKTRTLDVFDGAQPGLTNFRPEASLSRDGRIWFANQNILQVVDPSRLDVRGVPPPVHVEQIIADHKNYAPYEKLRLPALTRDIEIDYTALSLVVPEKVRFRYKLDGHDADWQDPQARRQAFYTDLPPGNYEFHVIASNDEGVWNEAGATLDFIVAPAFFQTAWFRLLCILCAGGLLWLLYVLRLRRVADRMQARFQERLEERERIARDLHDTLLQGIFSASMQLDIANDRLPADSPAKPLVERVLDIMRDVGQEGRNALRALRSPNLSSDDLEQSLSRIESEFDLAQNTDFRIVVEGKPREMRPLVRDEVYRIAREATLNAIHHAKASKIEIVIDYTSRNLSLSVSDNGCGIDAQVLETGREGHWGLAGMRERAERIHAKLEVLSRTGAGTEVQLTVPGRVAFESASGGLWSWFANWYPVKQRVTQPSDEEQRK